MSADLAEAGHSEVEPGFALRPGDEKTLYADSAGAKCADRRIHVQPPSIRHPLRPCWLVLAALALFIAPWARGLDPARALKDYRVTEWQMNEGLPYPSIGALAQSADGYLWLATRAGLGRFDGQTFTTYTTANRPELVNERISSLCAASDGTLWIGTGAGVTWYRNGVWSRPTLGKEIDESDIVAVLEAHDGSMLITRYSGLFRYADGQCHEIRLPDDTGVPRVNEVVAGANESFLAGRGLYRLHAGALTNVSAAAGVGSTQLLAIVQDAAGTFWLGSHLGLTSWNGTERRTLTTTDGLPSTAVRSLLVDRDLNLWVGTANGLARYRDGGFERLMVRGVETLSHVLCLLEDRERNLWIGTDNGLFRVQDVKVTTLNQRDGLPVNPILCVLEVRDGSRWVGTIGGGLVQITRDGMRTYQVADGLAQDSIGALAEDDAGGLWIAYYARGLSYFKNGQFTHYLPGQAAVRTRGLQIDATGAIWAANSTGLYRKSGDGDFVPYPTDPGLGNFRALHVDRHGSLWIGGNHAIGRLRDGQWRVYPIPENNVQTFFSDSRGDVWALRDGPGLTRFRDGGRTDYDFPRQLGPLVYSGFEYNSELWINFRAGVARIGLEEFDAVDHGGKATPEYTLYNEPDGMRSRAPNNAGSPGAGAMRDGQLWFSTSAGIAIIQPDRIRLNRLAPNVVIERVLSDKIEQPAAALRRLPAGRGELAIRFTALSLFDPSQVRFRYRLVGFDPNWIEAGRTREAYYGGLRPGAYRFEVTACNNEGVWNSAGASCELVLLPHFYQRWWFLGAVGLALAGAGAGVARWRSQRLQQQALRLQRANDELERRIAERTGELQASNDALRSSEYFYHSLVESLPQIIARKDSQGRYTYANAGFGELLGRPIEQIVGHTDHELYPAEAAAKLRSDDERILQLHQPLEYEEVVDQAGGGRRYLQVKKVPLFDERRQPRGIQLLFWDMTMFRETEDKLKSAQRELIEMSRLAGIAEMATGILHNLGNALTSVKVAATLAHDRIRELCLHRLRPVAEMLTDQAHRLPEFFATDERAAKLPPYLSQLVGHLDGERSAALQELACVESGIDHVAEIVAAQQDRALVGGLVEDVPPAELLEYACRMKEASLARHNVTVVREYMPAPRVRVQRQKALQILVNLIRNAEDSVVESGRPDRRLVLGLRITDSGEVQLSVGDNGVGIAQENLVRIFSFGFTSKKTGHGFGLHSSALAATEMNGSLQAGSAGPGKGATFVLTLPRSPAGEED